MRIIRSKYGNFEQNGNLHEKFDKRSTITTASSAVVIISKEVL
jgi:hypothetical protein